MIKNINELKQFITWCKSQRVSEIKIGEVQVKISELAYLDQVQEADPGKPFSLDDTGTLADGDELSKSEEEELLYWST